MFNLLINPPKHARKLLLIMIDSFAVAIAVWASFAIRLGDWWPYMLDRAQMLFPVALVISLPIFWFLGFYRSILRYAGRKVLYTVVQGSSLSLLLIIACWTLMQGALVPRSAWFIYWFVVVALLGGSRLLLRDYLRNRLLTISPGEQVIIYGAGVAGAQLATALQQDTQLCPIAFVDDSKELQGNEVLGLKVYEPSNLVKLAQKKQVSAILLALPTASNKRRRDILEILAPLPIRVMVMPSLAELAEGQKRIEDLREANEEDILGRDPIEPDITLLSACIKDKVVMVTGAGGSIGSELCRQILNLKPQRLVLFELSEYALYKIERELRSLSVDISSPFPEIIPILGSVNHRNRVQAVMETFAVQTIYHAAAYKHVPIVERNPIEGVQNNVFGTLYTAEAAIAANVETFVLISTDKAVRPTNVMGASKRFAELVLQGLAQQHKNTRFCMVRFGNVLASSGSVVPLFREQIAHGGPVTVTHPEMIRYFMTIPEAAQLVIQAGSMAKESGEVFLLNMGDPVNINYLARRMIQLSGYNVRDEQNPEGDIEIKFTGLRPGEKLYEELLINGNELPTAHPMIMCAREEYLPWPEIQEHLEHLAKASKEFNYYEIRSILLKTVHGYKPKCGIEDWVWVERCNGKTAA